MIKHYLELHEVSDISLTPDVVTIELNSRSIKSSDYVTEKTFAMMMYDRHEVLDGDELLKGDLYNYSDYYYIGDVTYYSEFHEEYPIYYGSTDYLNCITYGPSGLVKTTTGRPQFNFQKGYMKNERVKVESFDDIKWE